MKDFSQKIALYFTSKEYKIGELLVDAFLSETHELKADITEHPLESGSNFVDHISNQPVSIELEGIISNMPMTFTGLTAYRSFTNWQNSQSNDLAQKAFKILESIFHERKPITISTSLKDYKDMVLENLCIERGANSAETLRFRAQIKIT